MKKLLSLAAALSFTLLSPQAFSAVLVDIGDSGSTQSGWTNWDPTVSGDTINLSLSGDAFTATIAPLTSTTTPAGQTDLTDSGILNPGDTFHGAPTGTSIDDVLTDTLFYGTDGDDSDGAMFQLTFSGLGAGIYTWTGYHHKPVSSSNDRDRLDILLTDANNTGALVVDDLQQTRNNDLPSFASSSFNFTSNGTDDIVLQFDMDEFNGTQDEVFLNGFKVAVIPEPSAFALLSLVGMSVMILRRRRG